MKKLMLLIILLLGLSVSAESWKLIETGLKDFSLYVDEDSIKQINENEYVYAVKFQNAGGNERVVYLRSNLKTDYIGIIKTADYDELNYRPRAILSNGHAFMKPVSDDSFLSYAHSHVSSVNDTSDVVIKSEPPVLRENIVPVSYSKPTVEADVQNMKEFVVKTAQILDENWQPPKSGKNTSAIVILTLGSDGSLQNYKFAKSSGDSLTDRSIMSAVEKTVPYPNFPNTEKLLDKVDLQFVFEYKNFRKSVN